MKRVTRVKKKMERVGSWEVGRRFLKEPLESGEWRLIWQLLSFSFREEELQKVWELCTRPETTRRYITDNRVMINKEQRDVEE